MSKLLFSLVIAVFGFESYASNNPQIRMMMDEFGRGVGKNFRLTEDRPRPIRQARMKVAIRKFILRMRPDGTHTFDSFEVCSGSSLINVYDARLSGAPFSESDLEAYACEVEYLGNRTQAYVGGALALLRLPLFNGSVSELKGISPLLWFRSPTLSELPLSGSSFVGTTDINSHASILTSVHPHQKDICTNGICTPSVREYFTATIDVAD